MTLGTRDIGGRVEHVLGSKNYYKNLSYGTIWNAATERGRQASLPVAVHAVTYPNSRIVALRVTSCLQSLCLSWIEPVHNYRSF